MKALVAKDLPWLLGFLVAGAIAPVAIAIDYGIERTLVRPEHRMTGDLGLALWIPAALLAAFAVVREDLTHTRPYLLHRAVPARRIFWARALGCTGVIGGWTALTVVSLCAYDLVAGAQLAAVGLHAGLPLLALTVQAVATFAAMTFTLSLPIAWHARLVLAPAVWLAVHLAAAVLGDLDALDPDPLWVAGGLAVLAALFLGAAARHEATRFDADRPLPPSILASSGATLVVCLLPAMAVMLTGLQDDALQGLEGTRPRLAASASGPLLVGPPEPRRAGQSHVLDARHQPTSATLPRSEAKTARQYGGIQVRKPRVLHPRVVPEAAPTFVTAIEGGIAYVTLLADRRRVEVLTVTWNPRERRMTVLERPDGERFSPQARVFSLGPWGRGQAFLGDPAEPALWRLTLAPAPRLDAVVLPSGDTFVSVGWVPPPPRSTEGSEQVIVGRQHVWRLSGETFVAAPSAAAAPLSVPEHGGGSRGTDGTLTIQPLDHDILTPEIEVRDADGRTLRHRFGLFTLSEKAWGGLAMALSTLRPPVSALAGLAGMRHQFLGRADVGWTVDPLVVAGRPWLAAASVLLHAFLAWATLVYVRRRGGSLRRALAWSGAVCLAGVLLFWLLLAVETARAYRRPTVLDGTRRPLILSA